MKFGLSIVESYNAAEDERKDAAMTTDEDFDGPEALAKWRTRHIRNLTERRKAYLSLRAELEAEQARTTTPAPLMREDEIEAGTLKAYEDLQRRKGQRQAD